jgi:streptogramin lyase
MLRLRSRHGKVRELQISSAYANVRQIHGRKGEVWTPESGADKIVVYRYGY